MAVTCNHCYSLTDMSHVCSCESQTDITLRQFRRALKTHLQYFGHRQLQQTVFFVHYVQIFLLTLYDSLNLYLMQYYCISSSSTRSSDSSVCSESTWQYYCISSSSTQSSDSSLSAMSPRGNTTASVVVPHGHLIALCLQ